MMATAEFEAIVFPRPFPVPVPHLQLVFRPLCPLFESNCSSFMTFLLRSSESPVNVLETQWQE